MPLPRRVAQTIPMIGQWIRLSAVLGFVASVTILSAALWFLHRELAALSLAEVAEHIRSIPTLALAMSIGFAASSYVVLTGYDALALRYIGRALTYRATALTAFMAYAVAHNVGVATLSGGSIRYRMYSLQGLSATDIARIVVFVTITFGLGASGLLGGALLSMPDIQIGASSFSPTLVSAVGVTLLAVPIAYLVGSAIRVRPLTIRNWRLSLPRPSLALAQVLLSVADLMCAAMTLFVLLGPVIDIGFFPFLGIYLLAMTGGLVSSVPGGIGVFEAVLIAMLPATSTGALLGTVVVYRIIYYIAPLCLAVTLLAVSELQQHRQVIRLSSQRIGRLLSSVAPQLVAIIVFLAGIVLLISGASPAVESRLGLIARGIPLPVLELSHLAGSAIGVALLVLARGLYRRLRTAFVATLLSLGLGMAFSLLKGLDYEEALILGTIAIVLWICRAQFHRAGSVTSGPFSTSWMAAVVLVLASVSWVGLVSFRDVTYTHELWWQFALDADAPRTLRASVVVAIVTLIVAASRLLRAPPRRPSMADSTEIERVRPVLATAEDCSANAALLGDKRFLWSADGQGFIMYQVSGNSWIAFGDPVAPASRHRELVWMFRELVDKHNGRPVFYQVSDRSLPVYIDLGLTLAKLGEDGRVALGEFSLHGSERADLRQAINRANRNGATFEVVPRAAVPTLIQDLRRVSDQWLTDKSTHEKGFSLGRFSEAYIEYFDCAVVRVDGAIVAFANLWAAPAASELSIDLMRYDQHAPKGMMDYLFVQLMLWAAANGYSWFGLGMAPLSGMERRALAPLWHKLGHLVFTHGESFYNFEGLRSYKEKFHPEWRPRYLACPGGWLDLPWALIDSARLISGGASHVVSK